MVSEQTNVDSTALIRQQRFKFINFYSQETFSGKNRVRQIMISFVRIQIDNLVSNKKIQHKLIEAQIINCMSLQQN